MIAILFSLWFSFLSIANVPQIEKNRTIKYQEKEYITTYDVGDDFIGTYSGRKTGYLTLNADGTGEYKYDIFGFAPESCERAPIKVIWGFILDENGKIVKNKRDYGFSYPILMESVGVNSFQGCRKEVMKDFILKRGDELHVSSSDDWKKNLE